MVSGCSNAIFIKRCLQFLVPKSKEHIHWVDNSAARQLVAGQGVGKIRHLSGKIFWIRARVQARLLTLLHMLGAMDAETHEMLGQEEYELATQKFQGQKHMKNLVKTVMRMAMMMGLESFSLPGADAVSTCTAYEAPTNSGSGNLWLWGFIIFMCLLFGVFAYVMMLKVKKL